MQHRRAVVWLRRDLRLDDHVALGAAAHAACEVAPVFVLDPQLLRGERISPAIVQFFFASLHEVRADLRERGGELALLEGDSATELLAFAKRIGADALYFNADYDPEAIRRDAHVRDVFEAAGLTVASFIDHVYFDATEVVQDGGKAYTVFSPYKRRWRERFGAHPHPPIDSKHALAGRLLARSELGATLEVPPPEAYGHASSATYPCGGEARAHAVLRTFFDGDVAAYGTRRDFPALHGTSGLSPHLRAGTIGIRTCVAQAFASRGAERPGVETWIDELIWRDFYQQVLARFPHVARAPFLAEAERLQWRDADDDFRAWCEGRTGYPIVDAAMTQLNTYGWMHNRLRMIVASFLTKDLLIDWRRGEQYFIQRLADGDLAQNNGGWQWSASTGTDAAPYFRVFNPVLQGARFDPDGTFVRTMLPALAKVPNEVVHEPWSLPPLFAAEIGFEIGRSYPRPIVDHKFARDRALAAFAPVLGRKVPSDERRVKT